MLGLIFAALLAEPWGRPAFDNAEPTCVYREMESREAAKSPFKLIDAVSPCRSRFKWTEEEVELALKVTRSLVMVTNSRTEAKRAGIELSEIDKATDKLTFDELNAFGWEGEPKPVPEVLMNTTRSISSLTTDEHRTRGLSPSHNPPITA